LAGLKLTLALDFRYACSGVCERFGLVDRVLPPPHDDHGHDRQAAEADADEPEGRVDPGREVLGLAALLV
jgi:hypothetical protein